MRVKRELQQLRFCSCESFVIFKILLALTFIEDTIHFAGERAQV